MIALITSRLGVHVTTTTHNSYRSAKRAWEQAQAAGSADSASVWVGDDCVGYFGRGL